MKKIISASVLSLLLFGAISLNEIETGKFEVRDTLEERFTNKVTGRKVTVKRAAEGEASVSEVKIQQRYDEESRSYDFRFVAGINTVELDKARITITLGDGKTASKDLFAAYTKMVVGEEEQTASQVFGEGYDYLLAYVLSDVPAAAVTTAFDVNIGLVAEESVVAEAERNVKLSDIVDLDFTPSIEFANNDELAVVAGSAIELPTYTLTNGVSSVAEVKITSENGVVENNTYTPDRYSETGTHRLTYTAVNPDTGKEVVVGYREVKVAQKILSGSTVPDLLKVNDELTNPVITNADTGCSGLSFNFEASKNYYVEFDMAALGNYNAGTIIGFAHNLSSEGYAANYGSYYNGFKMNAGSYEFAHSRYQTGWSLDATRMWMGSSYGNRKNFQLPSIIDSTTKVAIARNNDKFYLFLNDGVYNVCVYPELQNKDTYPGVLFENNVTNVKLSNFTFIRDAEAVVTKINEVVGITTFDHYSRWGTSLANDYLDFTANNGVVFSDRGANHNDYNSNMASPYVHLYGNWTAEFDYKLGNTNWAGFHFDIRNVWDNQSVMDCRMVSWTNNFGENAITTEVGSLSVTSILDELKALTHRNTIHFTITCLPGNGTETYTITMNDGAISKTVTQVVTYTNAGYIQSPKYFIFKSQKWIGTISNFEYSTIAA